MRNLTIKKATMPKQGSVTSVGRKCLYCLCTALFFLTCSLSTKAQTGTGFTDLYDLPYVLGFGAGQSTYFQDSQCTSCSPFVNNYGDYYNSGNDKWIRITVADDGYLSIYGGTSDFDSIFYLYDSSWNLITSADDGYGSSGPYSTGALQPGIVNYYATAGTYYLIIDGINKYGGPISGSMGVAFSLTP